MTYHSKQGRLFTASQKQALRARQHRKCNLCGAKLPKDKSKYTADHVVPHAEGGPTKLDNGQALCLKCDIAKGRDENHRQKLGVWNNG